MNEQYYTTKEKEILENFFVLEQSNSKKDFLVYLENFVTQNGKRMREADPTQIITSVVDELSNFEYKSPNYLWGNEKNDNIVTYVFSHPNFSISSSKIKNLKKLKVNWNHINNEGENFLFYIGMSRLSECTKLIKEEEVKTDIINKNGEVFFSHIFNNYKSTSKTLNDCRLEDVRYIEIINMIANYEHLIALMSEDNIQKLKDNFHECTDKIEKKLYQIAEKENKNKRSYEEDQKNGTLPYNEPREYMNKIFQYHLLNKKLIIDETKEKVRKVKI